MRILFIASFLLAALLGPSGRAEVPASPETVPLALAVNVRSGDREVRWNREFYRLPTGGEIRISRLSFLLSEIELKDDTDKWHPVSEVAHLEPSEGKSGVKLGAIPPGRYGAIRFSVGLDDAVDLADPAQWPPDHPLNPVLNGLHWGMADAGYVYLAFEGRYRPDAGEILGFSYHLATARARVSVERPLDFQAEAGKAGRLDLTMDLKGLFASEVPVTIATDGTSTHSAEDDRLLPKLVANLPAVFASASAESTPLQPDSSKEVSSVAAPSATTRRITATPMLPRFRPPVDNPLTEEGIALGERLFHEARLSGDNSVSCASCHDQELAFTDGKAVSKGIGDAEGTRNSMPLVNLGWKSSFFWDGRSGALREQIFGPWESPIEMGGDPEKDTAEIASDPTYPPLFASAFADAEVSPRNVSLALEQFLLSLLSQQSRFDEIYRGREKFTPEEQRGYTLFNTEFDPQQGKLGADCFHCHSGLLLSNFRFHNNGLPGHTGGAPDKGRFEITGDPADWGKFATPSLRNIGLTAPYMHDGRFNSLREVLDHYNTGVIRSETLDPNLAKHPEVGLELSEQDIDDLLAFLETLDDSQFAEAE